MVALRHIDRGSLLPRLSPMHLTEGLAGLENRGVYIEQAIGYTYQVTL